MGRRTYSIIRFIRLNGSINTMNPDHKKAVCAPSTARKMGKSLSARCRRLWEDGRLEGVRVKGKAGWNYHLTNK